MLITDVRRGQWIKMKDDTHMQVLHVGRSVARPGGIQVPVFFADANAPMWVSATKDVEIWRGDE